MLSALNAAKAEYLVVGAFAMAAHGCPRATGDIDILVGTSPTNAELVWKALKEFGAPMSQITLADFSKSDVVYQIGIAPQRIDILTTIDGVDFNSAWQNRILVKLNGLSANVISREDLIKNKLATGRPKDIIDVEILRAFN